MKKPELLAPAGNLEKLKIAFMYGADAVYFGGQLFSLRAAAENFSYEDMKKGIEIAHNQNKKLYCAVNIMPRNEELELLPEFLKELEQIGIDAVIVSDLGVMALVQEHTTLPIHISTQANSINYKACQVYHKLGAERVVLARECTLDDIKKIKENIPQELELEVFIHGAMCISYSGRCLLSNCMTKRDSNRGACAQPCRWKYSLVEEKRPNEYFPIEEDEHGTYIMNSKDISMIDHIPDLVNAGISSFKIEGRVKSEYYVATIVNAYRRAIDLYFENPKNYSLPNEIRDEVFKVSHREYNTGFFYGNLGSDNQVYGNNSYIRDFDVVAVISDYDEITGFATCQQRNKFFVGDDLDVLTLTEGSKNFKVTEMLDDKNNPIESCPHANMTIKLKIPFRIQKDLFIRKEKK